MNVMDRREDDNLNVCRQGEGQDFNALKTDTVKEEEKKFAGVIFVTSKKNSRAVVVNEKTSELREYNTTKAKFRRDNQGKHCTQQCEVICLSTK